MSAIGALASPSPAAQLATLARQSVRRMLSDASALVVPLAFPLAILAINVAALRVATHLRGFPAHDVVDFAIGLTFLQGALFAAIPAATDLAVDIETGFLERLAMAPVAAGVLLAARLSTVLGAGLARCSCFLLVGLAAGARVSAGPSGVASLFALELLLDAAIVSVAFLVALRSRSGEVVQSLFPVFFVFLMLSSALMPRELINARWFRVLAEANPVSYLVEAFRSLFLGGWDPKALALGAGISAAIALVAGLACVRGLRSAMAREG